MVPSLLWSCAHSKSRQASTPPLGVGCRFLVGSRQAAQLFGCLGNAAHLLGHNSLCIAMRRWRSDHCLMHPLTCITSPKVLTHVLCPKAMMFLCLHARRPHSRRMRPLHLHPRLFKLVLLKLICLPSLRPQWLLARPSQPTHPNLLQTSRMPSDVFASIDC